MPPNRNATSWTSSSRLPRTHLPRTAFIVVFDSEPARLGHSSQAAGVTQLGPSLRVPVGLVSGGKPSRPRNSMGNINASVDLSRDGEIAVVKVDNPPVNALKHEVRAGLAEALCRSRDEGAVKAVVIACAGRTFFAGADITEFGKPPQPPSLHDVITAIEGMPKPVVAALHGTALGGGF